MSKRIIGYKAPSDLFGGDIKKGHIYNPGTNKNYFQPEGQAGKHYIPAEIASKWELAFEEEKPITKKAAINNLRKIAKVPIPKDVFEDIQVAINNNFEDVETPIRIRGLLRKRTETLQEFLIKFFTKWNIERATIWVDEDTIQTEADKKRSLGDIFKICLYYYPNCTLEEVIQELYVNLPEYFDRTHENTGFRTCVCQQIHKRVWWYAEGDDNNVNHKTTNDEFGKPYRWYLENLEE